EGEGWPGAAVGEEVLEALVRLGRAAEARELPHRPRAAAVHGLVDAAGEREAAGIAEVLLVVEVRGVARAVERRDLAARDRGERARALLVLALEDFLHGSRSRGDDSIKRRSPRPPARRAAGRSARARRPRPPRRSGPPSPPPPPPPRRRGRSARRPGPSPPRRATRCRRG